MDRHGLTVHQAVELASTWSILVSYGLITD
jgi:hypothetical protein